METVKDLELIKILNKIEANILIITPIQVNLYNKLSYKKTKSNQNIINDN